jgi:hypothetical protein
MQIWVRCVLRSVPVVESLYINRMMRAGKCAGRSRAWWQLGFDCVCEHGVWV